MINIRYRYPFLYWSGIICMFSMIIIIVVTTVKLPENLFFNVRNAVYYSIKAYMLDGRDADWVSPESHFVAEVKGLTTDGLVLLKNNRDEIIEAELADLILLDKELVAKKINDLEFSQIYVDFYQYKKNDELHSCVVLWNENGSPINKQLIDEGIAKPIKTPPTNIVHQLFARYYISKVFNYERTK